MPTPLTDRIRPGAAVDLAAYRAAGGYQGLEKALRLTPAEVQEAVTKSDLRGRGGAGFPTGQKWSFVPMDGGLHYFVVNADEKEPATMKDRFLMEGDPHQLIEGVIIASHAVQARTAYIFLRREYHGCFKALEKAIREARAAGLLGSLELHLHRSAGRYMCGEETGLLNALEGLRGTPRSKPPFPQSSGLFGKPTVVNNVETVSNLPHILREGWQWYKTLSPSIDAGTKIFGASGQVKNPGLWELPMGTTIREILDRAGGMRDGLTLRGLLPGGGSTDFVSAEHLDTPMDFSSLTKLGSRLGTGTIVVLDDKTCPVGMVLSLERFFARESCGWCTPCREGLPWVMRLLEALEDGTGEMGDLEILAEMCVRLSPGHTFCALAPGAVEPLQSALRLFREDFEAHVKQKRCPWK